MEDETRQLWDSYNRHEHDRLHLYSSVQETVGAGTVLYPGSFVDVAASAVFPSVTYVDTDRRTKGFFADVAGVRKIVRSLGGPTTNRFDYLNADYQQPLDLPERSNDLLISLYAGFVSEFCTRYLRVGGTLLVNPSHGDAAMASIDSRYELMAVVASRSGRYRLTTDALETYLVPKNPITITPELLHERGRGIGYTRSAFAYLFRRTI